MIRFEKSVKWLCLIVLCLIIERLTFLFELISYWFLEYSNIFIFRQISLPMVRMDWQPSPDGLRQILQLLKVIINHGPIGRDMALPSSALTNKTTDLVNSVQMKAVLNARLFFNKWEDRIRGNWPIIRTLGINTA